MTPEERAEECFCVLMRHFQEAIAQARAEALEEAARVAEVYGRQRSEEGQRISAQIAGAIRALIKQKVW